MRRSPFHHFLDRRKVGNHSPRRRGVLVLATAAAVTPLAAFAANPIYIGPTGVWSNYLNWSTSAEPAAGDAVGLVQSGAITTEVTLDDLANIVSIVTDNPSPGGLMIFTQIDNVLSVTLEQVGLNGAGQLNLYGGTHSVIGAGSNGLYIGLNPGSSGVANVSGAATALNIADSAFIGYSGVGIVNHAGGTVNVNGFLVLGGESSGTSVAGSGTYNFNGGTLIAGTLYSGLSGPGAFNHTAGDALFGGITLGYLPGSSGAYALAGGNLFVMGSETYGDKGIGQFTQTGGMHTSAGLYIGNTASGIGTLTINDGMFNDLGAEIIGNAGVGSLNQSGGTHVAQNSYIGFQPGSMGSVVLSGEGNLGTGNNQFVGYYGTGSIQQGGDSTNQVNVFLCLGLKPSSVGNYNLAGGTLIAPIQCVGYSSTTASTFTQTGGLNRADTVIYVGEQVGGRGIYNLSGGTLQADTLFAGTFGSGTLNQSGGVANLNTLVVGGSPSSNGTVSLSGGLLNVTGSEEIGSQGRGTFLQTDGTHIASGTVTISSQPGGVGSYTMTGGTFTAGSVVNNGQLRILNGTASFDVVSGIGTLTIGGGAAALVSANSLSHGNVTLTSGGTLNVGPAGGLATPIDIGGTLTINNGATMTLIPTPNAATQSGVQTNHVHQLSINSNGYLDLQNHMLLIDNTYSNTSAGGTQTNSNGTPYGTVQGYVAKVYNLNGSPNPGLVGDYGGRGGIGSSVAQASYAGGSIGSVSLVSYSGAQQDGLNPLGIGGLVIGPNAASGNGTGIPLNQTLVRATLTGDLNGDGVVDDYDITLFSAYGLYKGNGTGPRTSLGPQVGDFNHDGVVDDTDILIFSAAGNYLNGSYPGGAKRSEKVTATPKLTGAANAAQAASSGSFSYMYDPSTGDLKIAYNGFTGNPAHPFIPGTSTLSVFDITSADGVNFPLNTNGLTTSITTILPTGAKNPPTHIVLNRSEERRVGKEC